MPKIRLDAASLSSNPMGIAAVTFIDMAAHQSRVDEAADLYLAEPYIQHNPRAASGVEAFRQGFKALMSAAPDRVYDVKRVIVEGDFVVLHSHVRNHAGDPGSALVDIFRVENGKFVEHWDVVQAIPETTASGNTMF